MAHRYNDIVTLVRAGVEVPALVVQSSAQTDGEHLTVLSLDPAKESPLLSGMNVDAAIRRDFVSPLTDGKTFGWKEKAETSAAPKTPGDEFADNLMPHLIELSNTVGKIAPGMDISPDGTVKSANALLTNILMTKPSDQPSPLTDDEVYTQVRDKFLETEEIHPPVGSTVDQVFRAAARLTMTTVRTMQDVGDENKSLHAKIAEAEVTGRSDSMFMDSIMPKLTELSAVVAEIAPHMEISPDGTLDSAATLLKEYKKLSTAYTEVSAASHDAFQRGHDAGSYAVIDMIASTQKPAPKIDAPAQLDEAQGPVSPGDPESPHAIDSPAEPSAEPPAEPQS